MEFILSRFYKWTRVILWIVALIRIGLSQTLPSAVVWLVVALGYTIVPVLIARGHSIPSNTSDSPVLHEQIEEFKNTSPVIAYLNTLFDDISHINAISGDFGIRFNFAQLGLDDFSALLLYLTADNNRVDFIQRYQDAAVLWYKGVRGEGVKSPEELQKEFSSHFCYAKDGYVAKNASFRKELEEDFLSGCELDSSGWNNSLISFSRIRVGHDLSHPIAVAAITECAKAHGFHVNIQPRSEGYLSDTLRISF